MPEFDFRKKKKKTNTEIAEAAVKTMTDKRAEQGEQ